MAQFNIAKVIYNEARGEGKVGMAAVASTILNRQKLNRGYLGGSNLNSIVTKPSQYEGFYGPDPNPVAQADKNAWEYC